VVPRSTTVGTTVTVGTKWHHVVTGGTTVTCKGIPINFMKKNKNSNVILTVSEGFMTVYGFKKVTNGQN
jgi:hypothetical protein